MSDNAAKPGLNKSKILFLTQFSILLALEVILCFSPLGSIPITPAIVATTAGIPIVIAAVLMGTGAGALLGLITGIISLIIWSFMPPQPFLAFVFSPFYSFDGNKGNIWSVVISILPRVMIGVVAGLSYKLINWGLFHKKPREPKSRKDLWAYGIAGALGSLANTFFALGGIYLFFGRQYAAANNLPYETLLLIIAGVIATNGLVEAVLCAVASVFICRPLRLVLKR
jgi:uncharacterized membrane protein